MTCPTDIGAEVVEWLGIRGLTLSPAASALVRELIRLGPEYGLLDEAAGVIGEPPHVIRRRCRGERIPSPGEWLRLGRLLHAVFMVQRQPGSSLELVALESGYGGRSHLSRHVKHYFGLRPGEIRGTLGWEWMMNRWVEGPRFNTTSEHVVQ